MKQPALANLPEERQTTIYGEGNLPFKTAAGGLALVNATTYDVFSRPIRTEYGSLGKKVYKSETYDEVTGNEIRQTTDRDLAPQRIDDVNYGFDPVGNVTSITTTSGQDTAQTTDTQCFTNDALRRLTEAWTAKTDCSTTPSASTIGGPEPYWQSYSYDTVGNRTKLTDHTTGATTTYTHPEPGSARPHAVQTATVSGGSNDGQKSTFKYDDTGNTTTRTIGTTTQDLTWDDEDHLATLTQDGKTTSYQYDADGNRVLSHDADGSQTLTLPEGNELKVAANGAKTGVRYYTHGDDTVAVRTGQGLSYLVSDHQGTAMSAIAATTLAVTRRRQLPFGNLRSEDAEILPGTRGFVGGTDDPTGLTHLGAREYDPTTGSFLSVDPVLDINDPLQMNAYAYANSRPVTASDPDGRQFWDDFTGMGYGNTTAQKNAYKKWGYTTSSGKPTKKYKKKLANDWHNYQTYQSSSYGQKQMRDARNAEAEQKAADAARQKKDGITDKTFRFIHNNRSTIELVGDAGQAVNYGSTLAAGACTVITAGACATGVAEGLVVAGKIGAGVSAGSSLLQAVDSCHGGMSTACVHDGWGAVGSMAEIVVPFIPSFGSRVVFKVQDVNTAPNPSGLLYHLTKWMF